VIAARAEQMLIGPRLRKMQQMQREFSVLAGARSSRLVRFLLIVISGDWRCPSLDARVARCRLVALGTGDSTRVGWGHWRRRLNLDGCGQLGSLACPHGVISSPGPSIRQRDNAGLIYCRRSLCDLLTHDLDREAVAGPGCPAWPTFG
jgi:hypothetical protein